MDGAQVKKCNTCALDKSLEEFHWKSKIKGIKKNRCKSCSNEYTKEHYRANKTIYLNKAKRHRVNLSDRVREAKEKPCTDCKIQYPHYVMQFDHLGDKNFNISKLHRSWAAIQAEIKKCEVVCANCHAVRTYKRYHNLPL